MKCKDCPIYIEQRTGDNCSNCEQYNNRKPMNYTSNIITLDYDYLFQSFNMLLQLIELKKQYGFEVFFRKSSSGNGIHVKLIFDNNFDFDERILIRRMLGDDVNRIELDMKDYEGNRDTDLLFMMKSRRWVGEWIYLTIDSLNNMLNPIPWSKSIMSAGKRKRKNIWLKQNNKNQKNLY